MAGSVSMYWTGLTQLKARLSSAELRVMGPLAKALYGEARSIGTESVHLCPHDTGFLRSTFHVEPPKISGLDVDVALGYGADYAVYVHEILDSHHNPPTQAKYLEKPIMDRAPVLARNIAARMSAGFGI